MRGKYTESAMQQPDYITLLAKPPYVPGCDLCWGAFSYQRPDGTFRTCYGSHIAILVVEGQFGPLISYDEQYKPNGHTKTASGKIIDELLTGTGTVGAASVAKLRDVCGNPIAELPSVKETCDECNGSGLVECYTCGNEHDCPDCDGTGQVDHTPQPQRKTVTIFGTSYDARALAPLLAVVPDGTATMHTKNKGNNTMLEIRGPGWWIIAMSLVHDADLSEHEVHELTGV